MGLRARHILHSCICAIVAFAGVGAGSSALSQPACHIAAPGVTCVCDLSTLRPLQGAIGREEVEAKFQDILSDPAGERRALTEDPIKVVIGPGGALYITDHHHGASAWLRVPGSQGLCAVDLRPTYKTDDEFFNALHSDRLVRLADQNGKSISALDLPPSLAALPDDPYRSLAWRVRKANGFCRPPDHKEFVEFEWADWFRLRPGLPTDGVRAGSLAFLPTAMMLAASAEARDAALPGYVAVPPNKCPKKTS